MNAQTFPHWKVLPVLAVLAMLSCNFLVPTVSIPPTETIQTEPEDTATAAVATTRTQKPATETVSAPTAAPSPILTIAPTRRFFPSSSQSSPGGTCGEGGVVSESTGDLYDCAAVFSEDTLIQFIILKNGQEIGREGGVQNVYFSVDQNENHIYDVTENTAAYCIFGGNGPCNPWVLEDNIFKWGPGGLPVESGTYTISISPTLDDPSVNLFWSVDVTVTVP